VSWNGSLADLLLPAQMELDQNYPNPFNPSTSIPFALPSTHGDIRLEIYNVIGQKVRTLMAGPLNSGFHTVVWNGMDDAGRSVGAGLYISILEAGEFTQTRKMLLLK
jgi:flagellar hook assembly protein FlgD